MKVSFGIEEYPYPGFRVRGVDAEGGSVVHDLLMGDSFKDVNEKIADYDRMSAKVGDVLIKAEADADRIRAEAEEKAAERMKAAELAEKDFSMKETEMKAELERRREAAEKELDARIAGLSENRFRELNDTLESASAEIGKLLDKLKADIASKSQVADSTVLTVDEK